jgi:hypothetical protein
VDGLGRAHDRDVRGGEPDVVDLQRGPDVLERGGERLRHGREKASRPKRRRPPELTITVSAVCSSGRTAASNCASSERATRARMRCSSVAVAVAVAAGVAVGVVVSMGRSYDLDHS